MCVSVCISVEKGVWEYTLSINISIWRREGGLKIEVNFSLKHLFCKLMINKQEKAYKDVLNLRNW